LPLLQWTPPHPSPLPTQNHTLLLLSQIWYQNSATLERLPMCCTTRYSPVQKPLRRFGVPRYSLVTTTQQYAPH
jgi:hypothetical protein